MATGYRSPWAVTAEEDGDTIKVCVIINGLKRPLLSGPQKANAEINVKFAERSFSVEVTMNKAEKGKIAPDTFFHEVKQLPGDIVDSDCTWKVEKDQVILRLKKAQPEISWVPIISQKGYIETYSSDSDEDNQKD